MEKHLLNRIANHLIMNTSFIRDLGLYHGKMGIVIFFAHYARYTENMIYDDFAGEVLDEICTEIHLDTPVNFESGLCGIGWGIEYLLENGFMEGDSNEILSEIDQRIMELNVKRINDLTLRTGLQGILLYINKRISPLSKKSHSLFDNHYLSDIQHTETSMNYFSDNPLFEIINRAHPNNNDIITWKLGLENGCAGIGLNKILK